LSNLASGSFSRRIYPSGVGAWVTRELVMMTVASNKATLCFLFGGPLKAQVDSQVSSCYLRTCESSGTPSEQRLLRGPPLSAHIHTPDGKSESYRVACAIYPFPSAYAFCQQKSWHYVARHFRTIRIVLHKCSEGSAGHVGWLSPTRSPLRSCLA
jgi:hypothetical protein